MKSSPEKRVLAYAMKGHPDQGGRGFKPFEHRLLWLSNNHQSHDLLDCVSDTVDGTLVVFARLVGARVFGV
ncbi:hypothetical protein [Roseibium sp.]|uniref:hypothetical protein n=1 Tax=Roseibium sp. TaxID=1936156 RepID=UPI003BA8BBCC